MSPSSIREDSYDDAKDKSSVMSPASGLEDAKIEETIFNPELREAIANSHLDALSRRAIALYLICLVGFMNAVSNGTFSMCASVLSMCLIISLPGFDGSLMGGINAMTQYQEYFGYKEVGASTGIGEYSLPPVTVSTPLLPHLYQSSLSTLSVNVRVPSSLARPVSGSVAGQVWSSAARSSWSVRPSSPPRKTVRCSWVVGSSSVSVSPSPPLLRRPGSPSLHPPTGVVVSELHTTVSPAAFLRSPHCTRGL